MSADADLIKLYSGRILKLAAAIPLTDPIDAPMATVKRRSPLCGSTVTVSLSLIDGKISAFSQDVKACALGQASASIVGQNVIGCTPDEIQTARDQLKSMLKSEGQVPKAPFAEFEVLLPAREYKNRHASIMLALEATYEATSVARDTACA
ncbi:MAG: iron-sulfur cluster assembly scaffold protein [Pseudoruegeria sp.]